jgi:hypothetical protein
VSPWWLRIPVGLIVLVRGIQLSSALRVHWPAQNLIFAALEIASLIGVWTMKRWGPVLYLVVSAVHLFLARGLPEMVFRLTVSLAVLGAMVLVPSAIVWRRMRWW